MQISSHLYVDTPIASRACGNVVDARRTMSELRRASSFSSTVQSGEQKIQALSATDNLDPWPTRLNKRLTGLCK